MRACPRARRRAREEPGDDDAGEQRRSSLDAARARAELGWAPQTSLSEGLEKTIAYYRRTGIG